MSNSFMGILMSFVTAISSLFGGSTGSSSAPADNEHDIPRVVISDLGGNLDHGKYKAPTDKTAKTVNMVDEKTTVLADNIGPGSGVIEVEYDIVERPNNVKNLPVFGNMTCTDQDGIKNISSRSAFNVTEDLGTAKARYFYATDGSCKLTAKVSRENAPGKVVSAKVSDPKAFPLNKDKYYFFDGKNLGKNGQSDYLWKTSPIMNRRSKTYEIPVKNTFSGIVQMEMTSCSSISGGGTRDESTGGKYVCGYKTGAFSHGKSSTVNISVRDNSGELYNKDYTVDWRVHHETVSIPIFERRVNGDNVKVTITHKSGSPMIAHSPTVVVVGDTL